ncbi:exodeoxyribonuclease VII small subunit [Sphingobacteriales bacterium UPWRP_1]|nr:exodeoxyribonuclease VII small subunit [Sphingobacteriales bacterium TSM_CSS]PSJ72718.1 exodeoxyribonuclease VII small subunit [Sphingobacteriales bacterium UPWRP_1]
MSRKNKENMTYAEAMSELELIVAALEDEQTGVDELADKVKTASDLLVFCRNKLRATEEAINSTLENTNNQ